MLGQALSQASDARTLADPSRTACNDLPAFCAGFGLRAVGGLGQRRGIKAEIKTAQGLRRNEAGPEFDVPAVTALFSVPEKEFAWSLEGDGKTAKIMQSQPVLAEPYNSNSAQAKELAQSVKDAASKDLLTAYLTALQGKIGVSINDALWQQVSGSPNATP